jgi:hypothetical protein
MAQINAQTKKIITTLVVFAAAIGAVTFVVLSSGKFFTDGRFDIRPRASSVNCPAGVCPGTGRRYPAVNNFSGNCGQYIRNSCAGTSVTTVPTRTPTNPQPTNTTTCSGTGDCTGKRPGSSCNSNRGVCRTTQNSSCACVTNATVTPTTTSNTCLTCTGGRCRDGWTYGSDSCARQASCAQRAAEACANHGGI